MTKLKRNINDNITGYDLKYYETKLNSCQKRTSKKVPQSDFRIPEITEYDNVININFNVLQLKMIAKWYKLKVSGNKNELNKRIYLFLLYSHSATIIQKNTRRKYVYKYVEYHGPGFKNKSICVNDQDFFSLEKINEIDYVNFFSREDGDKVYGFDVVSLYNVSRMAKAAGKKVINPFTNCEFTGISVYRKMKRFIKLSNILNTGLNINSIDEENKINTVADDFNHRVRSLFHYIDTLGNYTHPDWFFDLSRSGLVKFIREIHDIWNYRAELSEQAKRNICGPNGNPFVCRSTGTMLILINDMIPTDVVRLRAFSIMDNMVRYSRNDENSAIGCYYLLGALTLVSEDASAALPWLYQCMYHG